MATDNGISLTQEERIALNRWLYRLLCEQSGPGKALTSAQELELHGVWNKADIHHALATISEELAIQYCEIGPRLMVNSSGTWAYLGQHHPELIVTCIKAGAFKEIGDEDADHRDN